MTTSPLRYASDPARHGYHCAACGHFTAACGHFTLTAIDGLFHNPAVGSPARFCGPACRQAAYRRRKAGAAEDTPRQPKGGRTRHLSPPPNLIEHQFDQEDP